MLILHSSHAFGAGDKQSAALEKIQHIVVISLENHSFDNIFGHFPGAEGLAKAVATQRDAKGNAYPFLPPATDTETKPPRIDIRFPAKLPNAPFPIDRYVKPNEKIGDLVHRFYRQQAQIHGGKMDRFALYSDAGGLAMGYYETQGSTLWRYAERYALADHFFHGAFGGSFLNHFWLVCACTPVYPDAPQSMRIAWDDKNVATDHGQVTQDGFAVETLFPTHGPAPKDLSPHLRLPPQHFPTIGDRLSERGISWAWYAGGWADAEAGRPDPSFKFHHQPFPFFARYAPGEEGRYHLQDEADFRRALADGSLPAVAFYKPLGEYNMHPGYANMVSGDAHLAEILQAIEQSPVWPSTVVIVTFDENGGFWDHVPPPVIDRWGPGMRVPTIVISPFVTPGSISHTVYDTTSILKLIETRFELPPLATRDAQANNMLDMLRL